jgi:hypothetical protein
LKPLAERVAETIAALETLDGDTRRLLEIEADQSPKEVDIVIDGEQVGYQARAADLDLHEVRCVLKVFEKWIESAGKKVGPSKEPRKPKLDDERMAVSALLKVWRDAVKGTSKPSCPTAKQFIPLVTEILGPVLTAYGVKASLCGLINDELRKKVHLKNTGT